MKPRLHLTAMFLLTAVTAYGMEPRPIKLTVLPPSAFVFTPQAGSGILPSDTKLPADISILIDRHQALLANVISQGPMVGFHEGENVILVPQAIGPNAQAMVVSKGAAMPKTLAITHQMALKLRDYLANHDMASAYKILEQVFDGPAVSAGGAPFNVKAPLTEVVAKILKAPFLKPAKRGRTFLRSLSLVPPAMTGPMLAKINTTATALQRMGAKLSLKARLIGPLVSSKEPNGRAFLGVFEFQGKPAGFFGYIVNTAKDGIMTGELHSVYFDKDSLPTSGIGKAILDFTGSILAPALGARREALKADYAGRYVWAKEGFQFNPKYYYYDTDGKKYNSWELARHSLARFLDEYHIRVGDLRLRGKPISALKELITPADFALLEHRQGRKVRVRPLVTQDTLGGETDLPVGKAFMMGNYLPTNAPFVFSQGGPAAGNKFASDVMPYWVGYRDLAGK